MYVCVSVSKGYLLSSHILSSCYPYCWGYLCVCSPRSTHYLNDLISLQLPRPSPVIVLWSRQTKLSRMKTEYLIEYVIGAVTKGSCITKDRHIPYVRIEHVITVILSEFQDQKWDFSSLCRVDSADMFWIFDFQITLWTRTTPHISDWLGGGWNAFSLFSYSLYSALYWFAITEHWLEPTLMFAVGFSRVWTLNTTGVELNILWNGNCYCSNSERLTEGTASTTHPAYKCLLCNSLYRLASCTSDST